MGKTGKAIFVNTEKKEDIMQGMLQFARDHIILFGIEKFIAGLFIGFGLGVYFFADSDSRKRSV